MAGGLGEAKQANDRTRHQPPLFDADRVAALQLRARGRVGSLKVLPCVS